MEMSSSLGTRHRAAVGISEVSDALTIIISEETGRISYTLNGEITIGVSAEKLQEVLLKVLGADTRPVSLERGKQDA